MIDKNGIDWATLRDTGKTWEAFSHLPKPKHTGETHLVNRFGFWKMTKSEISKDKWVVAENGEVVFHFKGVAFSLVMERGEARIWRLFFWRRDDDCYSFDDRYSSFDNDDWAVFRFGEVCEKNGLMSSIIEAPTAKGTLEHGSRRSRWGWASQKAEDGNPSVSAWVSVGWRQQTRYGDYRTEASSTSSRISKAYTKDGEQERRDTYIREGMRSWSDEHNAIRTNLLLRAIDIDKGRMG